MDQATYDEIFHDPKWYRIIDVVAILIIGLMMGATITYGVFMYRTRTEVIVPASNSTILPSGIKIEEV
jgi:hypothetical protein